MPTSANQTLRVEDGILVFPHWDAFSKALDTVNSLPDAKKDQWEMNLGFKSARTKYNGLLQQLEGIEDEMRYRRALDEAKDDIFVKGDELTSAIGSSYFTPVVNEKGIVRIGPDYYRFYNNNETIVLNGSIEKVMAASDRKVSDKANGTFFYNLNPPVENSGPACTPGNLSECSVQNDTRKSFHRLKFDRYYGYIRDPNTYVPTDCVQETRTYLSFSGQKRVLGT